MNQDKIVRQAVWHGATTQWVRTENDLVETVTFTASDLVRFVKAMQKTQTRKTGQSRSGRSGNTG